MIKQEEPQQNAFPRIRILLGPIMSSITRQALNRMELNMLTKTTVVPNAIFLFLQIVRSAIEIGSIQNLQIRQGLTELLVQLKLNPPQIIKGLKNTSLLYRFGILHPQDQPMQAVVSLTNFMKILGQPAGKLPTRGFQEQVEQIKKKKPTLSEYEKRRLLEKQKRLDAEMEAKQQSRLKLLGPRGKDSKCLFCGEPLHQGHFCEGMKKKAKPPERYFS